MHERAIKTQTSQVSNIPPMSTQASQRGSLLLSLAPELILRILQYLEVEDLIRMLAVCKQLHEFMENTPVLWTNIPLDYGDTVIDAFMLRAGPDLPLYLDSDRDSAPEWLYDWVQEHIPRARTLSMYVCAPWYRDFLHNLHHMRCEYPHLRSLALVYFDPLGYGDCDSPITRGFLGGQVASMTTLELTGVHVHGLPDLPALKTLELDETHTPLQYLTKILCAAPNVRNLTLINCIKDGESDSDDDNGDTQHEPPTFHHATGSAALLPHLERLIIREFSKPLIISLLPLLPDPSSYMEITEVESPDTLQVWSASDPATDATIQRLSQFRRDILGSSEVDPPVSLTIMAPSNEGLDSDLNDNSEVSEIDQKQPDSTSRDERVLRSHSTISIGSQVDDSSSSNGFFYKSSPCVSPITDSYVLSHAHQVALVLEEYNPQLTFDIKRLMHPSLATTVEAFVLLCPSIPAEQDQHWMNEEPLRNIFEWMMERHTAGAPLKTLRFEKCDVALESLKGRVIDEALVEEVIWC